MNRSYLGMAASVLLVGCATTPPAVVETAPASGDAMTCAAGVLAERGYDVRGTDQAALTLEAEVRRDYSPIGAVREIITTSLDPASTPAALTVAARAWEYQAAQHSLPVNRQSITEVRPSGQVAADARMVLETCGLGNGVRAAHS